MLAITIPPEYWHIPPLNSWLYVCPPDGGGGVGAEIILADHATQVQISNVMNFTTRSHRGVVCVTVSDDAFHKNPELTAITFQVTPPVQSSSFCIHATKTLNFVAVGSIGSMVAGHVILPKLVLIEAQLISV